MHYRIENDAGAFAVDAHVSNGVDATGCAFEAWWFSVVDAGPSSAHGHGMIVRDHVNGSAHRREATAVRAVGLCLATDPNAIEALVCFRDDPAGYQGIFSLDPDAPDDRIPMSDADVRSILRHVPSLQSTRNPGTALVRKEATWIRPTSPSSASRTSRLSFE